MDRMVGLYYKPNNENKLFVRTGLFSQAGSAINGLGVTAIDLVKALKALTGESNLQFLTMLAWASVVPSLNLLRRERAWCSACYQEWYDTAQIIYNPLIWAIKLVNVCPIHRNPLQSICPHCQASTLTLSSRSRVGYCAKCLQWLGRTADLESLDLTTQAHQEFQQQMWVAEMVGEMLAVAPSIQSPLTREDISKIISKYVEQVADGNLSNFSKELKVPVSLLWQWIQGEKSPSLEMLLRVSKLLNIPPANFLSQRDTVPVPLKLSSNKRKINSSSSSRQRKRFTKNRVQRILEKGLGEFPPPSLKEISIRTKSNLLYLSRNFPQLYSEIKARFKEYQRNSYLREMEQALLKILDAHEFPSPPMTEVAQRLNYGESTLRGNFPELCAKISAKYFKDQEKIREETRRETCRRIREIVYELHQKGEHPGVSKVGKILGEPAFSLTPIYWQAWKDALCELKLMN